MSVSQDNDLLLSFFSDPETVRDFAGPDWQSFLSRARAAGLLPRARSRLAEHHLLDEIPEKARMMLDEALIQMRFNQNNLRFEVNRVQSALSKLDVPIIVLKGGAYLLADLPPAHKRLVSDLDIMVEKEKLEAVEEALIAAGWQMADVSKYDEHHYRSTRDRAC